MEFFIPLLPQQVEMPTQSQFLAGKGLNRPLKPLQEQTHQLQTQMKCDEAGLQGLQTAHTKRFVPLL